MRAVHRELLKRARRRRGMTLIEIIVVITILALITAAIGVAVIPRLNEAKVNTAKIEIQNIMGGLKIYYAKKGKYPDTAAGLKALLDDQIIEKITDPWQNEYRYLNEAGKPVIYSYGGDGQEGGSDFNADISSKDLDAKPK